MSERIVVDPVTRIEGHLRIEAQTNEKGEITAAYSSGTSVRGLETILKGRDPRDSWVYAQRICGVCTLVHGIASVRAVEDALDYKVPKNAEIIRNLMIASQYIHDHVMHFYHLHSLDWVDVVSALDADPKATSVLQQKTSTHAKSSPGYFAKVKEKLKGLVDSGQLGIFGQGFWGHPEYKLPPEANLMVLAHYLEALEWQRNVVQLQAIFGGKNPHPNLIVGGAPSPISIDPNGMGGSEATAVNLAGLEEVRKVIKRMYQFVNEVYLQDTVLIGSYYKDWFARGEGVGNFMCYGNFPLDDINDPSSWMIPSGVILNRDLSTIHSVDLSDPEQIQEFVAHSWYKYSKGKDAGLHPYEGETELDYDGPKPPYEHLDVDKSYSWIKTPRWRGKPMEVGPLARILMLHANNHEPTKRLTAAALNQLGLPFEAMYSTMGRTLARSLESVVINEAMEGWLDTLLDNIKAGDLQVHNTSKWDPSTWPSEAKGVGFMEAGRGALAHYMVIKDGQIENYQAVVPSTWNAGPRDHNGVPSPYEAALEDGHTLYDPKQPLEIQRTIHSFDPCIACAIHVNDPDGEELISMRIV